MTKLFIDTSNRELIKVSLNINDKIFKKEKSSTTHTSQLLLPLIVELINENNLKLDEINEIEVIEGPGSFTGLRVGVAIANALSFTLGIPVNGKLFKNGPLVTPVYT